MNSLTSTSATPTLDEVLIDKTQRLGSKVFLNNLADGRQFSYAQLDEGTLRIGNGLLAAGVPFGGHVGVLMENCPEQLLAMWGVCRAGIVTVPVNSGAKGQLLTHFLGHSDCVAVIVERGFLDRVMEVAPGLPKLARIFVADIERADGVVVAEAPAPEGTWPLPAHATLGSFADLQAAPAAPLARRPKFSDTALLMFTSGTTGPSKANIFCQAQLIYYGTDVGEHHEYTPEDTAYVYLPLFHGKRLPGQHHGQLHGRRLHRTGHALFQHAVLERRAQERRNHLQLPVQHRQLPVECAAVGERPRPQGHPCAPGRRCRALRWSSSSALACAS